MRSPGINGGELKGQLANPGSPGKMDVKMECVQCHTTHPSNHFVSAWCNASSFSLFSDHIWLPFNIQLHTMCIVNFFSQQQGNIFFAERKEASDLNLIQLMWILAVTAASSTTTSIHPQPSNTAGLIHYFYIRTITNIHARLYFTISWTWRHCIQYTYLPCIVSPLHHYISCPLLTISALYQVWLLPTSLPHTAHSHFNTVFIVFYYIFPFWP